MAADPDERSQPSAPRGRLPALGIRLAQVSSLTIAGLWLLGFLLARQFRVCELLTHFQLQYFGILAISGLLLAVWRCWRDVAFAAVFVVATGWYVLPWYLPADEPTGPAVAELKIVSANVHRTNRNFAPLLALARDEDPDVLVLMEVDDRWIKACQPLRERFKYAITDARQSNFGIAVFSKLPLQGVRVNLGWIPSIVARIPLDSQTVTVVCTHPMPPLGEEMYAWRNNQLEAISTWLAKHPGPALVAGDLNITMWSPMYQQLETVGGLRNSRQGFGVVPTYHTSFSPGAIPIDHVLHTREFRVREFYRGADVASDHWPVVAVLELTQPAAASAKTSQK